MVIFKVILCSLLFVAVHFSVETVAEEAATNEVKPNATDGIWCFQCNSAKQKDCWDIKPFDTTSLYYKRCPQFEDEEKDAKNRTYFCRKITQTVMVEAEEDKRVIRKCGYVQQDKDCYKITNPAHKEIICSCNENGCNSAPANVIPSYLAQFFCAAVVITSIASLRL